MSKRNSNNTEISDDKPEHRSIVESSTKDENATIRIVSLAKFDGKVVVKCEKLKKFFLVPLDILELKLSPQSISLSRLIGFDSPYDWAPDVSVFLVTVSDVVEALYFSGMICEEELNLKKLLAAMFLRGKLPIVKERG